MYAESHRPTGVEAKAQEAYDCFETATRPGNDGERFDRVKDGSPEWVTELVHAAHGDFLPDDWRYACIRAALEFIADSDEPEDGAGEFADGHVDVYNAARVAWLGSSIHRGAYCDEALAELGPVDADSGVYGLVGLGQYMEASEVYALVVEALEDVDADEDDSE
jgi:hypothetical protein